MKFMTKGSPKSGFILLEVLISTALFALVGTALVVAINNVASLTFSLHREQRLARILDNELRRAMTIPNLQESEESVRLDEMGVERQTVVTPIEELENQDGQILSNLFRITVTAYWETDGVEQTQSTETWRYARLYRQ